MSKPLMATMGEGRTPLVASARIAPGELWFKLESCNPSGSYKDRFIAAQVTHLLGQGAKACVATSSGNTGSALAAYCARYGLQCAILVNQDAPEGKLLQMRAHGAHLLRIPGFTSDPALTAQIFADLTAFSRERGVPLVVSAFKYCPEGMSAVSAIAGELGTESFGHVFVPVGSGGLYSAIARGFAGSAVRVHAVQPAGCATVVAAAGRGDDVIHAVQSTTRISGLSVPSDIDASLALRHLRACGGWGLAVEDEAVWAAQQRLLAEEGIYAEPAGAAALAGWLAARAEGRLAAGERSVCIVSATGFKDPASAERAAARYPGEVVMGEMVGAALHEVFG